MSYLDSVLKDYQQFKYETKTRDYERFFKSLMDRSDLKIYNVLTIPDKKKLKTIIDRKYTQKLYLNSENLAIITDTSITWNYGFNRINREITANRPIKNIVGIRIYPFFITNSSRKLKVLIREFYAFAFVTQQALVRYHFDLYSALEAPIINNYLLKPNNDGYFWFDGVIKRLDTITLEVYDELNHIVPTNMNITTFTAADLISISATNPALVIFNTIHDLPNGVVLLITGFTTTDPVADAVLIDLVNNPAGVATEFVDFDRINLIDIDLTGLVGAIVLAGIEMRVIGPSMNLQIDFICLEDYQRY
jgi:hypothetical protein